MNFFDRTFSNMQKFERLEFKKEVPLFDCISKIIINKNRVVYVTDVKTSQDYNFINEVDKHISHINAVKINNNKIVLYAKEEI